MARDHQRRAIAALPVGIAYFIAASIAVAVTRFDAGVAFIWVATAILTARLTTEPRRRWPYSIAACFVASAAATVLFGLGGAVALPLAAVNVAEATIGAMLLNRLVGRRAMLESHRWLIAFVIATGIVAPALAAFAGAGTTALLLGKPFVPNAIRFYTGHALGTIAFMPIAMVVMRGELARLVRSMKPEKRAEQAILMLFVLAISVLSFAQDAMPLLFLPLLPIVLATFRGGTLATATSIVIVSIVGGFFTIRGHGPIGLMDTTLGVQMQFLQLYIAVTMLTVLPANAELERRAELFRRLRDSEARYRLITDNSTDIVLNIDTQGRLRFVSPSIRQIGGHDPEALIGRPVTDLVHADDAARVVAAHARALADPAQISVSEYRGLTVSGEERWFETHSRSVVDEDGTVSGIVSAIRDITHRKAREERLSEAAMTDPLTGLANRRAFADALSALIARGGSGCVALFDLDHFKQVNDGHGHAVGDEVLRQFAAVARTSVRDQDSIARIGGEEFAVILPEATIEQARLICDRLRDSIAAMRVLIGGRTIAVTVSGGVSTYCAAGSADAALDAADKALYRAKHAGRDQLALAA